MFDYTLIIRNAETNEILQTIEYKGYSGTAMMDECFSWRQYYLERGIEIINEW
jgi:hypothetical protein